MDSVQSPSVGSAGVPAPVGTDTCTPYAQAQVQLAQQMIAAQQQTIPASEGMTESREILAAQTPQQFYQAPPPPQKVLAELKGRVKRFAPRTRKTFWVWTETLQKEFKCTCEFFCPLQEGDALHGIVEVKTEMGQQVLHFTRPPFVQMAMDKDSVVMCFIKILRGTGFGNIKAHELYDRLADLATTPIEGVTRQLEKGSVTNYLGELASLWNAREDLGVLLGLQTVLSEGQAKKLLGWWHKNRNKRRLYLLGLNNREIDSCHLSCDEIYDKCLANPFTVVALSMDKCQQIFERIGKTYTPEQLRQAQIARKVYDNTENRAWVGTPSRIVVGTFPDIAAHMPALMGDYGVRGEHHTIYLEYPYKVETSVAARLIDLIGSQNPYLPEDVHFERKTLTEEQKVAIQGALNNPLSVITGIAGSGKTLAIGEIIHNLELREIPYMVTSFTGKAVARLREVVKRRSPATMNRLIARCSSVPPFKHLIIDEASMVTEELFYQFGQTFGWNFKVTAIGDVNQLQPIGWGSLFQQIIASKTVPIFYLTKSLRSDVVGTNGILINSQGIIDYAKEAETNSAPGEIIRPFDFVPTTNFTLLAGTIDNVYDVIGTLYKFGVTSDKLTIICPYNRFLNELNQRYQQIYNDGNRSLIDCKGKLWMVGDRVMMNENNYDINVMNGEEGIITDLAGGTEGEILVAFKDGIQVHFKTNWIDQREEDENDFGKKELTVKQLAHSFALTVHKSQGSEWEYIVIYIPGGTSSSSFLDRTLVYTAITRARKAVWCIGDIDGLSSGAIRPPSYRCDNLALRMAVPELPAANNVN